jgi:glycosyltransferase involved in cell wall biosynthesis
MSGRPRIHQFSPRIEPGAVASHTRIARDVLRAAGFESEIFAGELDPTCGHWGVRDARDYGRSYRARPDDRLVYQMAIGSPVAEQLVRRREPLVVNHHNLTPVRYLDGWDPTGAFGVLWGRRQLRALAKRARRGIAVSRFNETDLIEAGFVDTVVVPFFLDRAELSRAPDPVVLARLQEGGTAGEPRWLFVGRMAANKAQHDLVKALAAYRAYIEPAAQLYLVGGGADSRYGRALRAFSEELGVADAVHLTGPVAPDVLAAYFDAADVFVSCSEHEGFCVPIIEAMARRVPVVAFGAAAVPETAGEAALLLGDKDPDTVATAVQRVLTDQELRHGMQAAGSARVEVFDPGAVAPAFVDALTWEPA